MNECYCIYVMIILNIIRSSVLHMYAGYLRLDIVQSGRHVEVPQAGEGLLEGL